MNIRNIVLIMRHEIYATLRRAFFVIMAFGIPIVMGLVAVISYAVKNNQVEQAPAETATDEKLTQGFVDPAGWIQVIPPGSPVATFVPFDDENAARAALDAGDLDGYFLVSEDYLQTGELVYVVPDYSPMEDQSSTLFFESLLNLNLFDKDTDLAALAMNPYRLTVREVASESGPVQEDNWLAERLPFFLVILLYIVILVPASSLVSSITDEKKNRVLEILLSSVPPGQFFIGKLLALGLLGILQTLVWVGVIWGVAKYGGQPLNLPADFNLPTGLLVWAIVFSLTGYAMYGTQMAGIGALAPDMKDTRSLTLLVLAPLLFGYTFNIIFLEAPDSVMALILSLFPLTAPVVMIGRMASTDIPLWQPVLSLGLQVVAVVWIVRLFTRLFRAQTLLSGQTPTVRGLVKALREA